MRLDIFNFFQLQVDTKLSTFKNLEKKNTFGGKFRILASFVVPHDENQWLGTQIDYPLRTRIVPPTLTVLRDAFISVTHAICDVTWPCALTLRHRIDHAIWSKYWNFIEISHGFSCLLSIVTEWEEIQKDQMSWRKIQDHIFIEKKTAYKSVKNWWRTPAHTSIAKTTPPPSRFCQNPLYSNSQLQISTHVFPEAEEV